MYVYRESIRDEGLELVEVFTMAGRQREETLEYHWEYFDQFKPFTL